MPKFSFIIPMFNAEKSIARCLASIQDQTHHDWEAFIIDDGSSDNGCSIADQFAAHDRRFKIIRQTNQGPSSARNAGLRFASGEYISFVDADDWIENKYIATLLEAFVQKKADVVFFNFYKEQSNGRSEMNCFSINRSGVIIEDAMKLSQEDMFGYTWIKAFRRSVLDSVHFRLKVNLFEDEIFTCEALKNCQTLEVLNDALYHYSVGNEGALTIKTHQDYCTIRDMVFQAWYELLCNRSGANEIMGKLANKCYDTSKFYFFERQFNENVYLRDFSKCSFLRYVTIDDAFLHNLLAGRFLALRMSKTRYRMKSWIVDVLRKV